LKKNQLIDFFICSGWNTDFKNMNDWEKAQMVSRLYFVMRWDDGNFSAKVSADGYMIKIAQSIIWTESNIAIPDSVKWIMRDIMKVSLEAALATVKELTALLSAYVLDNKLISFIVGSWVLTIIALLLKTVPQLRVGLTILSILKYLLIAAWIWAAWYTFSWDDKIINKDGKVVGDLPKLSAEIQKKG
jgi:hypothetical protein